MNRPAKVTQGEIARAIRAAKQTGGDMCIEIAPDGTIRILPLTKDAKESAEQPLAPAREVVL